MLFPIYSESFWVRVILRQSGIHEQELTVETPQMLLKCERSIHVMAISKLAGLIGIRCACSK